MLLGIQFSWSLFFIDVLVYAAVQTLRIGTDMLLPRRWINPDSPYYKSWRWEQDGAVYQKYFNIRRWKDKLPAVNSLNNFSKKSLKNASPEYLRQFMIETCRGESHHVRSIIETLLFAIWNPPLLFCVILILSYFGHMPFIIIQRYNRPRLRKMLARLET
ncbi:MAG: hypothetical protein VB070_11100 [Clostridiaceae bacterium]|nr:hypothetical protein [Clostridiaceae bacterium]